MHRSRAYMRLLGGTQIRYLHVAWAYIVPPLLVPLPLSPSAITCYDVTAEAAELVIHFPNELDSWRERHVNNDHFHDKITWPRLVNSPARHQVSMSFHSERCKQVRLVARSRFCHFTAASPSSVVQSHA
ncbi:hypothetical protein F4678DRAFT_181286 [Xylaria arbuscula]|nr:hypothetical protein F4678DRAFT_181286 [Xylaria arbuscula]